MHHFVELCADALDTVRVGAVIGCIGPVTAETARSYGLTVAVQPAEYTVPRFAEAIRDHFVLAADAG